MEGGGVSPVSSPSQATGGQINSRASSALAAASVALILLCIFWRFVWRCKKDAPRNDGVGAATSSAPPSPPSCPSQVAGGTSDGERDENERTQLLVFVHVAAEKAECAVCLVEFGLGEIGRLVAGCGHGFHTACIETWFRVRSTCPLCRAAVVQERIAVDQSPRGAWMTKSRRGKLYIDDAGWGPEADSIEYGYRVAYDGIHVFIGNIDVSKPELDICTDLVEPARRTQPARV
ncbi:RING-H2 finger protein ATL80-like [Triticum dicoccoides]|uniref:RING-H2 finger protein ATL80-like n=1 Tax=Triticum dicoccoides TaxID=85692 RepID=UPI00188F9B01|nr:RING-H2 finger protein ATL80-like [Triticum dicoccoides]